ncbi:hypothetical protein AWV80_28760 [Cupriavidus sp. UYMU48A]|nr:hypothetical protein AWV80_28760 [Cupriavidus sp. UYMU48A]
MRPGGCALGSRNWRDEHLFVLGQALAMYDDIARHLAECDTKLQALLGELGQREVDLGKAPRAGSKLRVEFDIRQTMANWVFSARSVQT